MSIFEKLEKLKKLMDPIDDLRFNQFMFIINEDFYKSLGQSYRIYNMDLVVKDMFYITDEQFEMFIDNELKRLSQK